MSSYIPKFIAKAGQNYINVAPALNNYVRGKAKFTIRAVFTVFPCPLFYYRPLHKIIMFPREKRLNAKLPLTPIDLEEDVVPDQFGLVYPGTDFRSFSNGLVMYPNVHHTQEVFRTRFDECAQRIMDGESVARPRVLTIPKGTPVPPSLTLFQEVFFRFSLQPSRGMDVEELNDTLRTFFDAFAIEDSPESWCEKWPKNWAFDEEEEKAWMEHDHNRSEDASPPLRSYPRPRYHR